MGSSATYQNVSEVSLVSCALQKLLIFFMILDAAWMVLGYSFLGPLLSFIFHFIVLSGAKRGKTGVLLVYVVLNVIVLSFAAVGLLFLLGALMTAGAYYDDSMSSSSDSSYYDYLASPQSVKNMFARSLLSTTPEPTAYPTSTPSVSSTSSMSSSDSYEVQSDMLLAGSIVLLVTFIILYCKIKSVVLAARLRRLLLTTPVLPVHVTLPVDGVQEQADSDSKPLLYEQQGATFDDTNPMFAQPGFVPMQPQLYYPNIQGAPSMMPPPFMYGQHPVFYTFAPAPPANEKQ